MKRHAIASREHGHNVSFFQLLEGKHRCRARDLLVIFHVARAFLSVS
jgi:hypothetical protein